MAMQQVWDETEIQCTRSVTLGNAMKAMHIHNVYEIYMPLSSGVRLFVQDRTYDLEPGDVMLFSDADLHKAAVPADVVYDRFVIYFSPRLLRGTPCEELLQCFGRPQGHRLRLQKEQQQEFLQLVQVLQAAQETPPVQTGRWLALCQLLLFLCRMQQNTAVPQQEKSSLHPQIRTVLAYIDENFRQQVTLETLSEQCFLDRHYLCRLFKRDTGLCIHDYITYRRLSFAAALLRAGESVSTAANRSGFSSDAFFITTFKKNVGMTPYRYACRYRSQQ